MLSRRCACLLLVVVHNHLLASVDPTQPLLGRLRFLLIILREDCVPGETKKDGKNVDDDDDDDEDEDDSEDVSGQATMDVKLQHALAKWPATR